MPTMPFTEAEALAANKNWGANCGPQALAFALQCKLDRAYNLISGFAAKRYMNPTMMSNAIYQAGRTFKSIPVPKRNAGGGLDIEPMFDARIAIVRIQFTGPWTKAGANPKWGYRFTHWIATWHEREVPLVFDCNCGIEAVSTWEIEVVPRITESIENADGGWFPTHIWRLL